MAAATHEEPGCITYALHSVRDARLRFVLIERWESQTALDDHLRQPYVKLVADHASALAKPPHVRFCESVPTGDAAKGAL